MEENYPVPNVAIDAVEIAFAAISGLIAHKPKIYRELLPLEALLRKAMLPTTSPMPVETLDKCFMTRWHGWLAILTCSGIAHSIGSCLSLSKNMLVQVTKWRSTYLNSTK